MAQPHGNLLRGYSLALIGGLCLTFDVPTLRLADADLATTLLFRSVFEVAAAIVMWTAWRAVRTDAPPLIPGWHGVLVGLFYGFGSIVFITGVIASADEGATGALLFLLATSPLLAAVLAFVFLGERAALATWIALFLVLLGVSLIVGNPTAGSVFVKLCGFGTALIVAAAITLSRWSGRAMGFVPLIACILPAVLGASLMFRDGTGIEVTSWFWLFINGGVVLPAAFFCLAQAPRHIPAPQVALFYLLETTIAPIWLYLVFHETVPSATLLGGAVIVAAVIFDTAMQIGAARRRSGLRPRRNA